MTGIPIEHIKRAIHEAAKLAEDAQMDLEGAVSIFEEEIVDKFWEAMRRDYLVMVKHDRGDYRTSDGRWQITQPRGMDNGLQYRWIIREYVWDADEPGWFALDDDYPTLREARKALAKELSAELSFGESRGDHKQDPA